MLPRNQRLRKNKDFLTIYRGRRYWCGEILGLYIKERRPNVAECRLGVVVSKKAAKRAHDRNRIKRRVTEFYRIGLLPRLTKNGAWDILFVASQAAKDASYERLAADAERLLFLAQIITPEAEGL